MRERRENEGFSFWNYLLAGIVGVGSGFVAAYSTIRDRFHDDLRESEGYKKHFDTFQKKLSDLTSNWLGKAEKLRARNAPKTEIDELYQTFKKNMQETKKTHYDCVDKIIEHGGIAVNGIEGHTTGMYRRFQLMGKSRWDVVLNAAITTAIGAGGTLMFLSSRHIRDNLDDLKNKIDARDNARGA